MIPHHTCTSPTWPVPRRVEGGVGCSWLQLYFLNMCMEERAVPDDTLSQSSSHTDTYATHIALTCHNAHVEHTGAPPGEIFNSEFVVRVNNGCRPQVCQAEIRFELAPAAHAHIRTGHHKGTDTDTCTIDVLCTAGKHKNEAVKARWTWRSSTHTKHTQEGHPSTHECACHCK